MQLARQRVTSQASQFNVCSSSQTEKWMPGFCITQGKLFSLTITTAAAAAWSGVQHSAEQDITRKTSYLPMSSFPLRSFFGTAATRRHFSTSGRELTIQQGLLCWCGCIVCCIVCCCGCIVCGVVVLCVVLCVAVVVLCAVLVWLYCVL